MHGIIPLHRSNVIGINASRGDWLNELRMRLRTIWGSPCNYIMGEHYSWGWRGTWKRDFPPHRTHMAMTGRRLELRPEWKRLASKEMDSEAMVFMTLLPYKGGKGGGRDLFCKLRAWLLVVRRRWFSVQLTINPIKVIFNSRFKKASFDLRFSTCAKN